MQCKYAINGKNILNEEFNVEKMKESVKAVAEALNLMKIIKNGRTKQRDI